MISQRKVGRPLGVRDSTPRKSMKPRGIKDATGYRYADSGCQKATAYLGRQSLCLRCPFNECQEVSYRLGVK